MEDNKKKRILLKLSGEALGNENGDIFSADFIDEVASALVRCVSEGYEIAVVLGAGNIWRGRQGGGMDRTEADRMGMLATVINSIYMKEAIVRVGGKASVMTSIPMLPFAEGYRAEEAVKKLTEGEIVVFGGGLGIPFLSTDTAGAVRAAEIGADAMLMAKNIDYIYTADPRIDKNAKRLENIKASEVLALNLKAIDATATAFCLANKMTIKVFGLKNAEDIIKAVRGESLGTTITPD